MEILQSKRFESHSQSENGLNNLSDSKMTNMDPVVEPIFTKMIPCPGVGILKMIPCPAARPRTEKYMSTPPRDSNHANWQSNINITFLDWLFIVFVAFCVSLEFQNDETEFKPKD